jgi:hypothetical protein
MLKFLATILKREPRDAGQKGASAALDLSEDDAAPIFEGLAMTDELREALFPTTTQMVSAIFDRPPPLTRRSESPSSEAPASGGGSFPIIF